ncbi:hypothetical protein, partial [Klebsiella pneumoniae]|uniref:hypothetical protein n=1 Tax=Klebsiella pneumoniae TaxID=573 RepID=UPI001AE028FF
IGPSQVALLGQEEDARLLQKAVQVISLFLPLRLQDAPGVGRANNGRQTQGPRRRPSRTVPMHGAQ